MPSFPLRLPSFLLPLLVPMGVAWPITASAHPDGDVITWSPQPPAQAAPPAEAEPPAQAASSSGRIQVELTGNVPGITFHEWVLNEDVTWIEKPDKETGRSRVTHELEPRYAPLCMAPCYTRVQTGEHRFALSLGTGSPIEVKRPIILTGPSRLVGTYTSRFPLKVAGALIGLGAIGAGAGVILAGRTGKTTCDDKHECKEEVKPEALAGGGALIGLGLVVGVVLIAVSDEVDIKVVPLPTAGSLRILPQFFATRERTARGANALEGGGVTMQFEF